MFGIVASVRTKTSALLCSIAEPACAMPSIAKAELCAQLCNVCGISGKQTEMQPCAVCLDVSKPSKAAWCHEDCLSVAARHRMDKGRAAEWRCDACISCAR